MLHRKEVHPEKVRLCNNPINCGFKICWYKHKENEGESQKRNESIQEVDSENKMTQNFREASLQRKPSLH